jgi:choline dehydrogenase-like flavoprotein
MMTTEIMLGHDDSVIVGAGSADGMLANRLRSRNLA